MTRRRGGTSVTHEKRKTAIFNAADTLFGERGFDATSVRDVAEAAAVNKALVFYYFGSKDALFEQVLERYYQAHMQALRDAFSAGGPVRSRMHKLVDAYMDFIDANRRWPRLVQGQIAGVGSHVHLIARNLAPLYEWMEAALSEVAADSGPLAAPHFFLTFSGAVINYFTYAPVLEPIYGEDPLSASAVADRRAHIHWLVDVVLDGLDNRRLEG